MNQLADSDDDCNFSEPSGSDVRGLPRMLSQRMVLGDGDRQTLLKADSKRSLLTKSLSRSMVKLKNTVTHKGDSEEAGEEVVSLMEYEMLKAKYHVSEGTVIQQKEEIEHLQMQLNDKDDVIDILMQRLEAKSAADANANAMTSQRSKGPPMQNKRTSSLEEIRLKKRQLERAHSLRSPRTIWNGLQALESVLNFGGRGGESGNPTTAADSQPKEPISANNEKSQLQDTKGHTQESSDDQLETEGSPKSPHRRRRQIMTKQSSKRNKRRKNSVESHNNNSETSHDDSQDLTNTPLQSEKRVLTSSAKEGMSPKDRSKSPHSRRQLLTKQSSRRNRRKNSTETGLHNNAETDAKNDNNDPAADETKEGRQNDRSQSKSPHSRRQLLTKQSSKRNNRRKSSLENAESSQFSPEATAEVTYLNITPSGQLQKYVLPPLLIMGENQHATEDATRGGSISPNNRHEKSVSKQVKGRPSRRRSDDSAPDAVRNFRRKLVGDSVNGGETRLVRKNRAQARSAKARGEMKKSDHGTSDATLPFVSPRAAARRSRRADRHESFTGDTKDDVAPGSRTSLSPKRTAPGSRTSLSPKRTAPTALPNTPIFPASMGNDFNDPGFADFFDTSKDLIVGKSQAQDGTFVASFGGSKFGTSQVINKDEQQNGRSHGMEQGGVDEVKASEHSSQEVVGASGDVQKRSNGSSHEKSGHSVSTTDTNAFSTDFSMLSFNMDGIAEEGEKPVVDLSNLNERKSSQSISILSGNAIASDEKEEELATVTSKPPDETDIPEEVITAALESLSRPESTPVSPMVAQVEKETKPTTGRGRDYLLNMNRNETLGNAQGGESSRSRSLSPGWVSPRTPSGRRKLRIKKETNSTKKEPNLNKDFLKAEFQKNVKKFVMLNDQFQQEALPDLEAEKSVDMRSISCSFSNLGDDVLEDESKRDEILGSPLSEKLPGELRQPPIPIQPPPMSSISQPLSAGAAKKAKSVRWELEQNLYRLNLIPVYDTDQKKACFYNEEEIKKFRFELFMEQHAEDFDIHSVGDDMADDILDDMSFADEIVSDEDIVDLGSFRIDSRRGSM
ncbi:unnamed protein product [Cylindrotheca closterium]|uniref:Uncharacterized protein n=1 Tax=Cylindrotheca closterium TaxID=2856 RepID=A0AAD2CNF7_9STRA|nr:unnamed protein product [Cylindrotheca closterium]